MTNRELLDFLFADVASDAEEVIAEWVGQSRRFGAWASGNKEKIRRKLRLAQTPDAVQSLLLELDVARHLAQDKRCHVEYEKHGAGKERSPDLTVTLRTRTVFNLEVTQVQMPPGDADARIEKLIRVVCGKLGQVVPQMMNGLIVATAPGALTDDEVKDAIKRLRHRIDRREGLPFAPEWSDPPLFYKQWGYLSSIAYNTPSELEAEAGTVLWCNPQARLPLPTEVQTLLRTAIRLTVGDSTAPTNEKGKE